MASSSSSSYSALLRRSKLASFNPHIDQVYTTNAANLARSNFGLKRPLPAATTKTSPFVRLLDLDSREGRTAFRKATREQSYTRKWSEVGVGLQSDAFLPRTGADGDRRWDRLEVQSRFVDGDGPGAIQPVAGEQPAQAAFGRMPNVFAMSERDFERFLEGLGERRDEFKAFVVAESKQAASESTGLDGEFDLYAHAQRQPLELVRLAERFLRLPTSSSASPSTTVPLVHPTLALQYGSPTPLESSLAPPVPGRILGPSPDAMRASGSLMSQGREVYASVLSQVASIHGPSASQASSTNFFPDASGERSNVPGRASFRLTAPTIDPLPYAKNQAIVRSGVRAQSSEFAPATAEYEPRLLALRSVSLQHSTVVSPAQQARERPLPGSPAYSGALPADLARHQGAGPGRRGRAGGLASSLTEMAYNADVLKKIGVRGSGPRDLVQSRKKKRSGASQEQWVRQREALLEERTMDAAAVDKQLASAKGRQQGQQGQGQPRKGGKRRQQNQELLNKLEAMLNRES
ncbi:hypothetical protein Rhopal_001302-T1 [Rhodotorula paludigena]|uniref:Uncharacterized protein n=1 Tax=Rhodotorula paludigena TaxID=86838 RepID=A0AAV5GG48_9BASI|nr:hypothetical protein Rhopal_001302-T1 [Rhodotorula paludigena]